MHFDLVDRVLDVSDERIVTLKSVSGAEEYLQDHFPTFPVLPGVMMLEAMVQAARRLLSGIDPACSRHVLGSVRALRYGMFVRPGEAMRITVDLLGRRDDDSADFKAIAHVLRPGIDDPGEADTSVSGRFSLRPLDPVL